MPELPERNRPVYSGEKARQGRIVLNTPLRRIIFLSGLVGIVVLAILWGLWLGS